MPRTTAADEADEIRSRIRTLLAELPVIHDLDADDAIVDQIIDVVRRQTVYVSTREQSIGVQHDIGNFDLQLTMWDTDHLDRAIVINVAPEDIPALMREIVAQGGYALADAADSLALGPCDTCHNRRMVEVPRKHGNGTETVHCPDCREKSSHRDGFTAAPTFWPHGDAAVRSFQKGAEQ